MREAKGKNKQSGEQARNATQLKIQPDILQKKVG
jgi:hypothetical protein